MNTKEKHQILFSQLVLMFHAAAMQQMGKLKNPVTDKVERDLAAAQSSIDLLDMIKEKTEGNLSQEENRLLVEVLKELKLNYVDEMNKPDPAPAPGNAHSTEGKMSE
jgi:hypothetical protein